MACKKDNVDPEKPGNGSAGGHDYVDLGLPSGIKWATCNVGASAPEENGFYYAWGETNTKGTYNLENYLWYDQSTETYTKYTWEGNVITLETADDAAAANWGDKWRMPTQNEFAELQSNCNWQWTTQNDVNGWLVKGSNGNSIFLPAAGGKENSGLVYIGERGYYWTSSLAKNSSYYYPDESSCAKSYVFDDCSMEFGSFYRNDGLSVRPVYSGKASVSTTDVSEVSYYSATCGGYVSSGSSSVKARGVCWSTSQYPTINDAHTTDGTGTGTFTSKITGLTPNTKYFVRAYATNDAGTSYGSIMSFVTKTITTPTVTVNSIVEFTSSSVKLQCTVTDDGGLEITERGVCWSIESNPSITDNKVLCDAGSGSYVADITGIETDSKYYVKAFAKNSLGLSYSVQVIVEIPSGIIAGHQYIDLGLPSGTLWATCNVGAAFPEGYGNRYAWGEIEPKDEFYWDNYKWCYGNMYELNKYCTNPTYSSGTPDGKSKLDPDDDAASVVWGDSWRMPTYEEMSELYNQCSRTFVIRENVKGHLFTGPNGRKIFFPVRNNDTRYGYYWTSELNENYPYEAQSFVFEYDWQSYLSGTNRCSGNQIRPVVNQAK